MIRDGISQGVCIEPKVSNYIVIVLLIYTELYISHVYNTTFLFSSVPYYKFLNRPLARAIR